MTVTSSEGSEANPKRPIVCVWQLEPFDLGEQYKTACDHIFEFSTDPPHDWMIFCCYCGRLVRFLRGEV